MSYPQLLNEHAFNTLFDPRPPKVIAGGKRRLSGPRTTRSADVDLSAILAPPKEKGELGRIAHYRVLEELGRGGMGVVLLATDMRLQRTTALKVMLPRFARCREARERFVVEARATAKVRHPNIVTIFHVGEEEQFPYFAMEFLKGLTLEAYLAKNGEMTVSQAVRVGREIARGLQSAHAAGVVHRDIKPANIWLEAPKGHVKILDFGLARDEFTNVRITDIGMIVGTPLYMSPEQANGQAIDRRTDLFSLGVLLYRLCTSKLPFTGPTMMSMFSSLATHSPPPPRWLNQAVPPSLDLLIQSLLEKDRNARIQTAEEVVSALTDIKQELSQGKCAKSDLSFPAPLTRETVSASSRTEPTATDPGRVAELALKKLFNDFNSPQQPDPAPDDELLTVRVTRAHVPTLAFMAVLLGLWWLLM